MVERPCTKRNSRPARVAADSVKPGVERRGTPGTRPLKLSEVRAAADSRIITIDVS